LTNICVTKYWPAGTLLWWQARGQHPEQAGPASNTTGKAAGISPAEFLYLGDSDIDMKPPSGRMFRLEPAGIPFRKGTARLGR